MEFVTADIECIRTPTALPPTARTHEVAMRFGLPLLAKPEQIVEALQLRVGPGRIVLIEGPSGSGKSSVLQEVSRQIPGGIDVDRVNLSAERSVIDAVCPNEPISVALETLNACGLGETPIWVRSPAELSDGQKFRARLARAVGIHLKAKSSAPLLCDEFCSGLHRRLAKSIAFNLRKLASRHNLSMVIACGHDDVARDLQPDTIVRLSGQGRYELSEQEPRKRMVSFAKQLLIVPGCKADYDSFAAMHYRATDELGFVDKVFVMRDRQCGDLVGIVVYSHGPLELSLRNQATDNRFLRNPARLNREVRILRRLVIHPDVRGCGLGHHLIRRTLPLVGTRFVECLASMGEVNPVFEKAGMSRVGTCTMPQNRAHILQDLHDLEVDPFDRTFVMQVARRPRVRRLVSSLVFQWYQATTAGGERRVARQSPEFLAQAFRGLIGSRPVYFLWERPARPARDDRAQAHRRGAK